MAINRLNVSLSGVQPGGLAKVVPASVAVGSGSGSVDSNGTVTFSGASSVSLNGCFTSSFTNYKIVIDNLSGATASQDVNLRLRVGGVDASTGIYNSQELKGNGTSATAYRTTNNTVAQLGSVGYSSGETSSFIVELQNPQAATRATWLSHNMFLASGIGAINVNIYGYVSNVTQYDGFTIFGTNYNITGALRVYGYN